MLHLCIAKIQFIFYFISTIVISKNLKGNQTAEQNMHLNKRHLIQNVKSLYI